MQQIELHCKACNIRLMDYLDESDLLALMDDEQVEEYMNKTGVGEKEGQPVAEEVEEEKTEEPVVEEKPVNNGFDPDADYNEDEENYLDSIPDDEDDIDDAEEEGGDVSSITIFN